jgi:RimJ/RimL family protein N-acetyltransferase
MRKVELVTPKSTLRAPLLSDAADIAAACQDGEIQRWVPIPVPYALSDAVSFVRDVSDPGWASGSTCTWAVVTADRFAGVVSVDRISDGEATVGFWMAPERRGRGLARDAVQAVIDFAFAPRPDGLALTRLEWHAYAGNLGSACVARSVGFRFEGTRRLGARGRDGREDDWVAGLVSSDRREPVTWPSLS